MSCLETLVYEVFAKQEKVLHYSLLTYIQYMHACIVWMHRQTQDKYPSPHTHTHTHTSILLHTHTCIVWMHRRLCLCLHACVYVFMCVCACVCVCVCMCLPLPLLNLRSAHFSLLQPSDRGGLGFRV
jgi:hypothetical protein